MSAWARITRMGMWLAAGVFVATVVIWIGSAWWVVWWDLQKTYGVNVAGGRLGLFYYSPDTAPEIWVDSSGREIGSVGFERTGLPFRWWFVSRHLRGVWEWRIPLWVFIFFAAGALVAGVCVDRIARGLLIRPWAVVRWISKWMMTVGVAAIGALWVTSLLWSIQWRAEKRAHEVGMWGGRISLHSVEPGAVVAHDSEGDKPGLRLYRYTAPRVMWWFETGAGGGRRWWYVPLWTIAMPLLVGAVWIWRTDFARRRLGGPSCVCGYSRAGLAADATCPECGGLPARVVAK